MIAVIAVVAGGAWAQSAASRAASRVFPLAAPVAPAAVPAPSPSPSRGLFEPTGRLYPTGSRPSAVAIGDVNGDARADVVVTTLVGATPDETRDRQLVVFTQNEDGSLAPPVRYAVGGSPTSVAIGDVTGDHHNDVLVANETGIGVLAQTTDGTLDPVVVTPTQDALRLRLADITGEGRLDVISVGRNTSTLSVFLQEAGGGLAAPVVYPVPHGGGEDIEVGDLNGDGFVDVALGSGSPRSQTVSVVYQKPDNTFAAPIDLPVQGIPGVGLGDLNTDGRADLAVALRSLQPGRSTVIRFLQKPDGTLAIVGRPAVTADGPGPVETTDLDEDGRDDVVLLHAGAKPSLGVYLQTASGSLAAEQRYLFPFASQLHDADALAVGDVNGDRVPDVVFADHDNGRLVVLLHKPVPKVSVLAPADVTVLTGVASQVRWIADGEVARFDVLFSSDGGASFSPIPTCRRLAGTVRGCPWTPSIVTTRAMIKVVATGGNGMVGQDTAALRTEAPVLTVTEPDTRVTWEPRSVQTIRWTSNLDAAATILLEVSRNGGAAWSPIAEAANTGSYNWTVTGPSTGMARIRATWTARNTVRDISDVNFQIDGPPVAVAGPDQTASLGALVTLDASGSSDPDNDPLTYRWTDAANRTVSAFKLVRLKPPIGTNVYTLTVVDRLGAAATDTVTVVVVDTAPPVVKLTTPVANAQLTGGAPVEVRWTAVDASVFQPFKLAYSLDDGATFVDAAGCADVAGTLRACTWTPPAAVGPVTLKLTAADASNNTATSLLSCKLAAPSLTVAAPNTKVAWRVGTRQSIFWRHNLGTAAFVKIELSTDGGASFTTVAESVRNTGSTWGRYQWTVAGPATTQARIRATWVGHPTITDDGDVDFVIAP